MMRIAKSLGLFLLPLFLTGCAGQDGPRVAGAANQQDFEITGEITYRERIALPPQVTAIVELRDVSVADAQAPVIAEQRIDPAGRQVPIPFRLVVERGNLQSGHRYSVRGTIVDAGGQLLWTTTENHSVDPTLEKADLGTLMMLRASTGTAQTLTGRGNEPGWRIDINEKEITLLLDNGKTRVRGAAVQPQVSGNTRTYITTANGKPLTATFETRICNDNMSGMPHPLAVVLNYDGRELHGCGGNPAELLHGQWAVAENATVTFAIDGTVSGRSYCNSYGGTYTLTGETLTIKLGASTLMACAEDLMKKEKEFTTMLGAVQRFEIAPDGSLVLHTSDGQSIVATRKVA